MTQPFHFPDGRLAHDANDLLELCQQYPDAGTDCLVRQDLEKWLAYIGSYDVAECAVNARQTDLSDRQKLEEFLNKCHSLTLPKTVPAAATKSASIENQQATTPSPEPIPVNQPSENTEENELAVAESSLKENKESASDMLASPIQSSPPAIDEGQDLAALESTLNENSEEPTPAKKTAESTSTSAKEKPSFFQVVAKFIVSILYRNKA